MPAEQERAQQIADWLIGDGKPSTRFLTRKEQFALAAGLQAAQEREKALREALRRTEDELAEAAAHIGRARLAAQRTEEPGGG